MQRIVFDRYGYPIGYASPDGKTYGHDEPAINGKGFIVNSTDCVVDKPDSWDWNYHSCGVAMSYGMRCQCGKHTQGA
jgi:hypothetical protein